MKLFKNKRCPRCNYKMPIEITSCPSCQLNFVKFESATNTEAKEALREGEKDRVLLRTGCPSDVSKIKLLLIAIFLGFAGAHYYVVGRTKIGILFSTFFGIGLLNAILTLLPLNLSGDLYQVFQFIVLGWGLVMVIWIIDIAKICFNKFKIPVSRS